VSIHIPPPTPRPTLFPYTTLFRSAAGKPELKSEVFAPGIISTDLDESGGSFSGDGKSFYFVRRSAYTTAPPIGILCFSVLKDGTWTRPEIAAFSGTYVDGPSCFSPDDKRL